MTPFDTAGLFDFVEVSKRGVVAPIGLGEIATAAGRVGVSVIVSTIVGRPLPTGTAPGYALLSNSGFHCRKVPVWCSAEWEWAADRATFLEGLRLVIDERFRVHPASVVNSIVGRQANAHRR